MSSPVICSLEMGIFLFCLVRCKNLVIVDLVFVDFHFLYCEWFGAKFIPLLIGFVLILGIVLYHSAFSVTASILAILYMKF